MTRASAMCPGSCGELIQGVIGDRELLVSYAINRYSRVTLTDTGMDMSRQGPGKARAALKLAYEHMGLPACYSNSVQIDIVRELPVGKGMASSTADIGAVVAAASSLRRIDIDEEDIVRIALQIEPTDSTLFGEATLFDPLDGSTREKLGFLPSMKVIVLEGNGVVDTQWLRKQDYMKEKRKHMGSLEKALAMLRHGIRSENCDWIGKAAVISARCNQGVLEKLNLEHIIEIAEARGACGVNVAHSGTVIGVLVNIKKSDPEYIIEGLELFKKNWDMLEIYPLDIIPGGVMIL